ncbi:hypothetical protein J1614_005343 [Plenodomus biglobosus]|nr:hypothetical protein J1614_005343 [Plenodomus biglobosus]
MIPMAEVNKFLAADDYDYDARSDSTLFEEGLISELGIGQQAIEEDRRIQYKKWDQKTTPIFTVWRAMIESKLEDRQADEHLDAAQKAHNAQLEKQWLTCLKCLADTPTLQQHLDATFKELGYPWKTKLENRRGTQWAVTLTHIVMELRGRLIWGLAGRFWGEGKKDKELYEDVRRVLSARVYEAEDWGVHAEMVFEKARELCDGKWLKG